MNEDVLRDFDFDVKRTNLIVRFCSGILKILSFLSERDINGGVILYELREKSRVVKQSLETTRNFFLPAGSELTCNWYGHSGKLQNPLENGVSRFIFTHNFFLICFVYELLLLLLVFLPIFSLVYYTE